ncbi:MAG TPA: hypothetical protein VHC22_02830 [Pirellulales bacterium]|nr:hypothetical protein [Pirellulales bacterium]
MKRMAFLLALLLAACCRQVDAAYPGNGFWGVQTARKSNDDTARTTRTRRASHLLDVYPPYNAHFDNSMYARGMTLGGGSAYQNNEYNGRGANYSYSYYDGGFNPGGLYSFSLYPHFDRPGFTYWQGGD